MFNKLKHSYSEKHDYFQRFKLNFNKNESHETFDIQHTNSLTFSNVV